MKNINPKVVLMILFICNPVYSQETVTDIDGNVYQTGVIGNQVWMLENLKTTTLNDGEPIPEFLFGPDGDSAWFFTSETTPMFVTPDTADLNDVYDFELPVDFYGIFYSLGAVTTGRLAPVGWRVASERDWNELENFVAQDGNAGATARALRGVDDWLFLDAGKDIYGFKALPAGFTTINGTPDFGQVITRWTTTDVITENGDTLVRNVSIFMEETLEFSSLDPRFGCSVRCVRDLPFLLGDVNRDGSVDLLDVSPFVELLSSGTFVFEADINQDGSFDLLDVAPFIELLSN